MENDADWWRQAVVYQIYPRSFADSNADGIGDLRGIASRMPYLEQLGVDAIWMSPFYPSALADGGYDVDDFRNVAPELGDLDAFDEVVEAAHTRGIRVIVDIVPNHTSNRHDWFVEALAAGRGSDARDRYHFREGTGPDGTEPPNDWQSMFGGSAWTRVDDGQWYLHLFAPEQPDLNWDRRDVRDDFLRTLRFWSDRGVDGFRVDVAFGLAKDMSEPFATRNELAKRGDGEHPYFDRDEVHEIFAEWRKVFNEYDPPRTAVAEVWVPPHRQVRYATPSGLGQAFNFDLLLAPWEAEQFRAAIVKGLHLAAEAGSSTTWVLSNHDVVRHPTRYGQQGRVPGSVDLALGTARARAATMLLLAIPGSTYIYQGEELGLFEVADIPPDRRQDPTFFQSGGTNVGRDGCRVPLPWSLDEPAFGFGAAPPHLPQPDWFGNYAVSVEDEDPNSMLHLYRTALRLRRGLQGAETLTWIDSPPEVLHFTRPGGWHCLTNFGPAPAPIPAGELILISSPVRVDGVPADTTIWYRPDPAG